MIKVLFLILDFRLAGVEKIILYLVNRLDRNRFQPVIVAVNASGPLLVSVPDDVPVFNLRGEQGNMLQFPWKVIRYSYMLRKIIMDIKPSIVISGSWFTSILSSCLHKSIRATGGKLILAFHIPVTNFIISSSFANIFAPVKKLVTSVLFNRAEKIIAISHTMKQDLITKLHILSTKISEIYNGIDVTAISAASMEANDINLDFPYLVAVGRLENVKGHDFLIRSFSLVSNSIPHNLIIVGEGSCCDYLQKMVMDLGLEERIMFTGGLSNPYPIMKNADFLVLSSLWEAFPFVLLEALALKVPVIATASDGPIEILDHGKYGTLVPVGDETALAEAICRYAVNPEERLRFNAQSTTRVEGFSLDRMVKEYEDLFINLCDEAVLM